jgi:predicted GNAT family acetyltransferase
MSQPNPEPFVVRHNTAASRFEVLMESHLAVAEYQLDGDRMTFTHTFVPPEWRGRGIAEKLVRPALEWAQLEKRRVVPACSYVAVFIERNPEFKPLLA